MIWEKEEKELRAIVDRLTGKTTTKPVVLDQDDSEEFDRYLTGRYVTDMNMPKGEFDGTMTLDDGTVLEFEGNKGCCCRAGNFTIIQAFKRGTAKARIMSARTATSQVTVDDWEDDDLYTVFVMIEGEEYPLVEYQGYDSGYYGYGFTCTVRKPDTGAAA
nr:MAG TPA: hypothetical protein [Siphoviridae sp. ctcOR4]DAO91815.1 MAG TPA: hypothetical protein [Caudoviricetes sp.]